MADESRTDGDLPARRVVAGADGCRDGWVVVLCASISPAALRLRDVTVVPDFRCLLDLTKDCDAVSVDVPIGLSDDGFRAADGEARRIIGPRRSSVFTPPPRAVLEAPGDYDVLNALSRQIRAGLSRQTYNILPKLREADASITPALQARVAETSWDTRSATRRAGESA